MANGCYVAVANRIGRELVMGPDGTPVSRDGLEFWGQSFIASPDGTVIKRASTGREEVLVVECDLDRVEFARTHWPFLRDRRVDAYGAISERFVDGPDGRPVNADGIEFWGQSFVAAPDGSVVKRASVQREEVMVVECDLDKVEFARTHWPFLRDRRVDAYGALTERFVDGTSLTGRR